MLTKILKSNLVFFSYVRSGESLLIEYSWFEWKLLLDLPSHREVVALKGLFISCDIEELKLGLQKEGMTFFEI